MSDKNKPDFEAALTRLEDIVRQLEGDSVSLDESIKLYEEGIELSKLCTKTLEEAELRIEKVNNQNSDH